MLQSNSHVVFPGSVISPRSPLDMKSPSHGSSRRYDYGGIGLGIVAALEKSYIRINRHEFSSKHNPVSFSESGSNRLDPVHCAGGFRIQTEIDLFEEYTCVTSSNGLTKVYHKDVEFEFCQNPTNGDRRWKKSPAKKREVLKDSSGFLTSCCLCKKKLQGKDIYMYKGDKGFCSQECRSVKIMEDGPKVQQKSKYVEVLSSPYAGIFVI